MKYIKGKKYTIDINKIKTIDDIKIILKQMGIIYTVIDKEKFDEIKYMLKEEK